MESVFFIIFPIPNAVKDIAVFWGEMVDIY